MLRWSQSSLLAYVFLQFGEVGSLILQVFRSLFTRPFEKKIFIQQLESVGVRSLPVVSLTAAFGGLVFGLQSYVGFHRYVGPGSEAYAGPVVSLGLSKELIPIFVGLMISGRVGSSMAAEIGTMKITEQLDALYTLGADAYRYLVLPRTLACVIMLPLLTLYGDLIGMAGGYFYNVFIMGVNRTIYLKNTLLYLELWDVYSGLIKSVFFGFAIAIIGCWQGLRTEAGAEGVGKATTRTVVIASITVLILNFFLSKVLPANLG